MKIIDQRNDPEISSFMCHVLIYPHIASLAGYVEARAVRELENDGYGRWRVNIHTNVSGGDYGLESADELIAALLYARKLATLSILLNPDVPLPEPDVYPMGAT